MILIRMLVLPAFAVMGTSVACAQELEAAAFPLTAVNPASTLFPGGRGTDELILYDGNDGRVRTGTNEFGSEAEVVGNIIVQTGGNNRSIPSGGYVLSGHGSAAKWLQSLGVGDSIVVRNDSCVVLATVTSLVRKASAYAADLKARGIAVNVQSDIRSFGKKIPAPRSLDEWQRRHRALDSAYAVGIASAMPSRSTEWRGVWHRPHEHRQEAVDSIMRRLANAGFNAVFLETFWGGEAIYPSDLADQRREFRSFDVLKAYVAAGKHFGIEIHAWLHTFFLGYENPGEHIHDLSRALREHPSWMLVHKNGSAVSASEYGYIWGCPANPAVQEYVGSIYREIARRYDIAGIQHDYIRYPTGSDAAEYSCYCAYCRAAVHAELSMDIAALQPGDSVRWGRWEKWKEDRITTFVRAIRDQLPQMVLSAAVFPDLAETRRSKMQNWAEWIDEGLVTFLTPMCYTSSTAEVAKGINEMRMKSGGVPLAAGLAPFLGLRSDQILDQMTSARSAGSTGIVFFELTSLSDVTMHALKQGPFRVLAKTPQNH